MKRKEENPKFLIARVYMLCVFSFFMSLSLYIYFFFFQLNIDIEIIYIYISSFCSCKNCQTHAILNHAIHVLAYLKYTLKSSLCVLFFCK